jgi:hypothetical protein
LRTGIPIERRRRSILLSGLGVERFRSSGDGLADLGQTLTWFTETILSNCAAKSNDRRNMGDCCTESVLPVPSLMLVPYSPHFRRPRADVPMSRKGIVQ